MREISPKELAEFIVDELGLNAKVEGIPRKVYVDDITEMLIREKIKSFTNK